MASPFRTLCVASANRRATTTNRCSRRSPWPLTALGRYALDDHAETVVTLLDKLGVRGCEVIGHSAGGSIAVLIAPRPGLRTGRGRWQSRPRWRRVQRLHCRAI